MTTLWCNPLFQLETFLHEPFYRMEGIMKKILIITVAFICSILILFFAKKNLMADPGGFQKCKLTKLWETKADLRVPESVLYNPSEDIIYISNINGKPTEKNGKGFISKVLLNGKIEKLKSLYCRRHQK